MRVLFTLSFSFYVFVLFAQANCVAGDCENGFGTFAFVEDGENYYYEGYFKDGQPHGVGVYRKGSVDAETDTDYMVMGHFDKGRRKQGQDVYFLALDASPEPKNANRHPDEYVKPSDKTSVTKYTVSTLSSEGEETGETKYFLHYSPNGETILLNKPFTIDYGSCDYGNCQDGKGSLIVEGIGEYKGSFKEGMAHGNGGFLILPTGEVMLVDMHMGIPVDFKTIELPEGVSRVGMAKRRVFQLPDNSCLEGECWRGSSTAKRLRGSADRLKEPYLNAQDLHFQGYVKAYYKEGEPTSWDGTTLYTFYNAALKGDFSNGLDGAFTAYINRDETKVFFRNGNCFDENGKPCLPLFERARESYLKEESRLTSISAIIPEDSEMLYEVEKVGNELTVPVFSNYDYVYLRITNVYGRMADVRIKHGTAKASYKNEDGLLTIKHINNDKEVREIALEFDAIERYRVEVFSPTGASPERAIVERIEAKMVPQLEEKYGYSLVESAFFPISDLPMAFDWTMYGGNDYGALAICSDGSTKLGLSLLHREKEKQDVNKPLIEGKESGAGITELNPNLKKISDRRVHPLVLQRLEGDNDEAYVVLIIVYRSKDNTAEDSSLNKPEDFYVNGGE